MYDYGLSVLEQYGLTASFSVRVRGALLCRTEKGPVILREFHGSEKKLSMQQQLLEKMKEQNCLVDAYLRNREGVLVSRDKDSVPYTAQVWFEGRECDTRSENDILKSIRTLAQIHKIMQLPVEMDYAGRNLQEEYVRHNQEMKKIRRFIRKKGAVNSFEEQLIGKKVGEEVEVNVTFPEQYQAKELAGKPAMFKVTIKEIKVKEYPELDDDFAQDVSEFDTLDEYKADIKKNLEEKKAQEAEADKDSRD